MFATYSYTNARYEDFKVITLDNNNKLVENDLRNNFVENAPLHILRTGVTVEYKNLMLTYQYSFTDEAYGDANNTKYDATAIVGLIPAYHVSDLHLNFSIKENIAIKAGINNLFDARYFTRRAPAYPGPGALPADGRSFYFSVGGNF